MTDDNKKLGRLEAVTLRSVWNSESDDFTPWLAREENLVPLGDTIGLELELEAQEKNVGPFRADILCKETANNTWVLIENQLEHTDHTHLGQLLTYAAGLSAVTIVWIAKRFTEEHRAALDWLNEITGDDIAFFALEVELWKIGDSAVAPKFNVVSSPNEWTRAVIGARRGSFSETQLLQREYWATVRELLLDRESVVKPQKPLPQCWTCFAVGNSQFGMHASVNSIKRFVQVGVDCYGPDAKSHFHLLKQDKDDIEREVGCELDWEELPEGKQSRIAIRKMDTDPTDREDWPAQHDWIVEKVELLHQAFAGRIKELGR